MASTVINYIINFTGNGARAMNDITRATRTATGGLSKFFEKARRLNDVGWALGNISSAFGRVSASVRNCTRAYEMQSTAERKLETLMRNSIGATDDEIRSIKDLTAAQQRLGVIGDEVQLAGAQELSTYITKTDSLKKLIPAMNDMLAQQYGLNASQEQAVTIAQMMGKVLDGQVGALSRYGYRFDQAQEAVLKFGKEEERVAMLSGIVTQYVGGVNAALAATPEGKMKQLANSTGDVQERVGALVTRLRTGLAPVMQAVIDRANGFMDSLERGNAIPKITAAIEGLMSVLGRVGGFLADHRVAVLSLAGAYKALPAVLRAVELWERRTAVARLLHIRATHALAAATKLLKSSLGIFALAATAIVGATLAVKKFIDASRAAGRAVSSVAARIGVEKLEISRLFDALKRTNPESERRKNIIDEMNRRYPGLLTNLGLEKASELEIEAARKKANNELERSIYLEALKEKEGDAAKEIFEAERKLSDKLFGKGYSEGDINSAINAIRDAIDSGQAAAHPFDPSYNSRLVYELLKGTPFTGKVNYSAGLPIFDGVGQFSDLAKAATRGRKTVDALRNFGRMRGYGAEPGGAEPGGGVSVPAIVPGDTAVSGVGGSGGMSGHGAGGGKNISIVINKLVENITLNLASLKEGREEIRRAVADVLLTAVNDVNAMGG